MVTQLSLLLSLDHGEQGSVTRPLPIATVRLSNEGPGEIIVNRRLLLVPEEYPIQIGEITFRFIGPPDSFSLKVFNVNAGRAGIEFFVRLLPGEFVEKTFDLNNYFAYEIPGQYRIRAIYRNEVEHTAIKEEIWKGELMSNEEQFII